LPTVAATSTFVTIRRLGAAPPGKKCSALWGAPRIHGELLRLGIVVSERTVSRYLRGRPTTRSQSWRTFFANHLGDQTFISPVMVADAPDDDIVVDASDLSFRPAPSIDASCASIHGPSVDWRRSRQHSSLGVPSRSPSPSDPAGRAKEQRPGPAAASTVATSLAASGPVFFGGCPQCLGDQRQCDIICAREVAIGDAESLFRRNSVVPSPRTVRSARDVVVCDEIRTAIGMLAKHSLLDAPPTPKPPQTEGARAEKRARKGQRPPEAGSAAGESRRISEGNWLLRLDSNQQPSG
jgi:hypothetical protein